MDGLTLRDESTRLLERLLDVEAARQKVAVRNLANAGSDTYEPRRVEFSRELERAIDRLEMRSTNPKHLRTQHKGSDSEYIGEVVDREGAEDESVRLEKSATELADAQLAYSVVARLMSKRVATLRTAITGKP